MKKEKTIQGYRLKQEFNTEPFRKACEALRPHGKWDWSIPILNHNFISIFRRAGILDLWFDPVEYVKPKIANTIREQIQQTKQRNFEKAMFYINEHYCDVHLHTPYLLLGDVLEVVQILTGIPCNLSRFNASYKK